MSHLPLDARAILEYLNELGYRNISAEQLKEFMKGMQPQSENSGKSKHRPKSSSNQPQQQQLPATDTATAHEHVQQPAAAAPQQQQQRTPKVIKCKRPLQHFKFYLDIRDHQLAKKIEDQIKSLGGSLEFFLTPSVTHFITDKSVQPPSVGNNNNNNNNTLSSRPGTPITPATPGTPQTPYSLDSYDGKNNGSGTPNGQSNRKTRQSRADAILNRARRQSTTTAANTTNNNNNNSTNTNVNANAPTNAELTLHKQQVTATTTLTKSDSGTNVPQQSLQLHSATAPAPYTLWQTADALRFFKKVRHELRELLDWTSSHHHRKLSGKSYGVEPIYLKGGFIKIEALKRNYRPYYHLFRKPTEWPKIELTRDDGAFRLSPRKSPEEIVAESPKPHPQQADKQEKMTRKSRSRSSQRPHPLPAAVQALKKGEHAAKTSTGPRDSHLGGCKQVKESSEKQCGVCEICKIEYDTLTIHLKTKDHEYFAKNTQNFIALDTLIHASANVNQFLDEKNEQNEFKPELQEMEVEEDIMADVNAPDPLEHAEPLAAVTRAEKRRCSGAQKTPSPTATLREKSKRTTKGKHSSEKFQNVAKQTSKSPKTPPKSAASLQKKLSSSMMELQHIESTANTMGMPKRGKKPSTASQISPPIRAMLPPSSLYKVVEAQEICTPPRRARDVGDKAVASPSLIVKFKKVRQAEVLQLNGEAENFMFPKQRTSSELPTDVDRQTTSENTRVSVSSVSLDSTSELMDTEAENDEQNTLLLAVGGHGKVAEKAVAVGKKAIATAKRRKGQLEPKQSFPNAPIQPEVLLKRLRKPSTMTLTPAARTATTLTAATMSITLPEATRKSSRTATAIVTAATTSSRLLRAAVEAAKNNSRRLAAPMDAAASQTNSNRAKCWFPALKSATIAKPTGRRSLPTVKAVSQRRALVVQPEDRMGEDVSNSDESDNYDENDQDTDEESDDEEDDDDDEDYVSGKSSRLKGRQVRIMPITRCEKRASTRAQRATRREHCRSYIKKEPDSDEEESDEERTLPHKKQKPPGSATKAAKRQLISSTPTPTKKSSPQRVFDHTTSDRLQQLRYAFERLPATDLWYRVFSRQDVCEERYFEYFGSTKYRKLPYELGPIPFERTLNGNCCTLCQKSSGDTSAMQSDVRINPEKNTVAKTDTVSSGEKTHTWNNVSASTSSTQYAHKHKKLHLLQRYRQEQQELQKQQQLQTESAPQLSSQPASLEQNPASVPTGAGIPDSKASTPDREAGRDRERAGSTHSTSSSYASSSATQSKKLFRNKHLSKAAFLSLELPPRKSPREHASTLALVSCIIKQRQDSQSKPNSETDEPLLTTSTATAIKEEQKPGLAKLQMTAGDVIPAIRSPRSMRSAAATPVEELRFATEISENVKRMRRGQNKYDHSPPIVLNTGRRARSRAIPQQLPVARKLNNQLNKKYICLTSSTDKRRKPHKLGASLPHITQNKQHHSYSGLVTPGGALPSIRKTGSKKGVLEFEVDAAALKALDAATKQSNIRKLEWEIDKYLQLAGKEFDLNAADATAAMVSATQLGALEDTVSEAQTANNTRATPPTKLMEELPPIKVECATTPNFDSITPPPTDYFSSDFDLCDLFTGVRAVAVSDEERIDGGKQKGFSLYSSVALQNYFRRRKTLKSNRTGWPKVQKKKVSVRQQQLLQQKIRFLQDIGAMAKSDMPQQIPEEVVEEDDVDDGEDEEDVKDQTRESTVMTPPESDVDALDEDTKTVSHEEEDANGIELDPAEESNLPEEDDVETMADSIEGEPAADIHADADEEDEDEEEVVETADEDADEEDRCDYEPENKRVRRSTAVSPAGKLTNNCLTPRATGATSTPSAHLLRGLRRTTPQLNGSLGSCISPSEKAGDNSDIFTVSSDGLDTDLDVSNSHSQHKTDDAEHQEYHNHCPNHTPKRKFDLSKYAPKNATTCAAEAATAAAKSLAISQFLKKEVRVTCRRLRAPFRRFRYRR